LTVEEILLPEPEVQVVRHDQLQQPPGPQLELPTRVDVPAEPVLPKAPPEKHSPLAHQSDYLWLVGILERGTEVGVWSLRYAGPEENDPYGGRLNLVSTRPIAGYRVGQVLRVEGHLAWDILQTVYQVEHIEVVSTR